MVVHRNIQLSAFSLSTTFLHGQLLSTSDLSIYFVSTRFFFFRVLANGLGLGERIYARFCYCFICSIPMCCVRCGAAWVQTATRFSVTFQRFGALCDTRLFV